MAQPPTFIVQKLSVGLIHRQPIFQNFGKPGSGGSSRSNVAYVSTQAGGPVDFVPHVWLKTGLSVPFALNLMQYPELETKLKLQAQSTIPDAWKVPAYSYSIILTNSNQQIVLQSDPVSMTNWHDLDPAAPSDCNVVVSGFKMTTPKLADIVGPFQSEGSWTASIAAVDDKGQPLQIASIPDPTSISVSGFFFTGVVDELYRQPLYGHRIEIIKGSVMPISTYTAITPKNPDTYATAAAHCIAQAVWTNFNNSAKYDVVRGGSSFGVGPVGGTLNLKSAFTTPVMNGCNCYDLAAVNQAYCASLGQRQGSPVLDFRWVYSGFEPHTPGENWFGYVTEGQLFGWPNAPQDMNRYRCNSPFWRHPVTKKWLPSWFQDLDNANRQPFGNHAWSEVLIDGEYRVLETCHAAVGGGNAVVLAEATQDRDTWWGGATNEGILQRPRGVASSIDRLGNAHRLVNGAVGIHALVYPNGAPPGRPGLRSLSE